MLSDHFSLLVEFSMNIPNLTAASQMLQQGSGMANHMINHSNGASYNQGFNRLSRQPSIGSNRLPQQQQQQHGYGSQQQPMMLGGLPPMSSTPSSGGSSPSLNNGHPYSMMSFLHQNGGSATNNGGGHSNMMHNNMSRWLFKQTKTMRRTFIWTCHIKEETIFVQLEKPSLSRPDLHINGLLILNPLNVNLKLKDKFFFIYG